VITDNQGGERSQFIDELISLEEAVERLEGAKLVVDNLNAQIELHKQIARDFENAADLRTDFIAELQRFMVNVAVKLSGIGDHDHRAKNAAILAAVHELLVMSRKKLLQRFTGANRGDVDEIPF